MKPIICLCFYLALISNYRVDLTPVIKPVQYMSAQSVTKPAQQSTVTVSTKAKNSTSVKSFEYYDNYDDQFYKDYYNEDYVEEKDAFLKQETKLETSTTTTSTTTRGALQFLTNKSNTVKFEATFNSKVHATTTTVASKILVNNNKNKEYIMSTPKPTVVNLTASTQANKKTTTLGDDEYDFSDYYDDYYDEDYLSEVAKMKTDAKSNKVVAKLTTKSTTTKPTETAAGKVTTTTETYDYYDYLDAELPNQMKLAEASTKATRPSLKLNKEISLSTTERTTVTTKSPNLLDKSVTKKADEYDEYYEDDEYKEDYFNYDDYYDENYEFDEVKNSSTTTTTSTISPRPELKAPILAGDSTTKKTPTVDEYDEDNYEYYYDDDKSKEYNYKDEYYDDELDKIAAEKTSTIKSTVTTTVTMTTTTSSTREQPAIVLVPDVIETVKQPMEVTTTTTKTATTASTNKPFENEIYFNELDDYIGPNEPAHEKPNNHSIIDITLIKGDLRLKELIKSPALLAGIFGGLLLGLITALLLLIYIIYRVRHRRYQAAMKYDLDADIKNVKYYDAKERKRNKKLKAGSKKKSRKGSDEKTKIIIDDASSNDQNLLSSSQLSTPSNNATGSTNSNTGLITEHRATLMNNSRLLKYTSTGGANSLRIVSSTLSSSNESSNSPNNENSFDYAYIKAPTKEFYA